MCCPICNQVMVKIGEPCSCSIEARDNDIGTQGDVLSEYLLSGRVHQLIIKGETTC